MKGGGRTEVERIAHGSVPSEDWATLMVHSDKRVSAFHFPEMNVYYGYLVDGILAWDDGDIWKKVCACVLRRHFYFYVGSWSCRLKHGVHTSHYLLNIVNVNRQFAEWRDSDCQVSSVV